jgi:DNA-binding Lrp family transcriptional regulator
VSQSTRTVGKRERQKGFGQLDKLDFKIISLLILGYENKQIARELGVPLSTVQRRSRNIIRNGLVDMRIQPNFRKIGVKKGLLHVYLKTGDLRETAAIISKLDGILGTGVHVGNSDVVSHFVYEDSDQLIGTIVKIKRLESVERVLWSEEVYEIPIDPNNVIRSFKKMWNNSPYNKNGNGNGQ